MEFTGSRNSATELPIGIVECDFNDSWFGFFRVLHSYPRCGLMLAWLIDQLVRCPCSEIVIAPMRMGVCGKSGICHTSFILHCISWMSKLSYKYKSCKIYNLPWIKGISKPQSEAAMEGLRKDRYAQTEWWHQPQHGAAFSFSRSVANCWEAKVLRFFVRACFGPVDRFWDPKSWSPIGFTELTCSQEIICTIGPKSWDPEAWAHKARKFVDGFEAKQSILT